MLSSARHEPQENRLLAALAPEERERIYPQLELISMPLGKVLYEPGGKLQSIYFPADCIVSLLYMFADGVSAEIAIVGNEGLVGIASAGHKAVVVEVNSETDFVARNQQFQSLVKVITDIALEVGADLDAIMGRGGLADCGRSS